jgi:ABC-type sugar transport system ATPase subunit
MSGGGVSIRSVTKFYGSVQVLPDLSVDVRPGEFIVFVGPSGCGKSTLLRMIAGLEAFQSGEIAIDGRIVNALHPSERDIAMVFQDYALYPHMTVRRNMGFGLQMRGTPAAEIETRVREAAATLQIEHLLERRPRELSGGQRQRVAMGRAIVRKPKVFLFDEPLSNLDAKLRVDMRGEIKALHQRLATTSIYVTHDQVEAMTMADRIVVMNHGRIEQVGVPLALYHEPATRFVAGFLGAPAMNFLPVEVNGGEGVLPGGGRLPLPGVRAGAAELGVRPERLRMAARGDAANLHGTVAAVEPLGADTLAFIDCAGHRVVMRLPGDSPVRVGDTAALAVEAAALFDPASGERLVPACPGAPDREAIA